MQSIRKLPIHPELIRLGFIDYVAAMRDAGRSANPVHAHLCVIPRVLNSLGLGRYQHLFCFPRGQKQLAALWEAHRTLGS